MFCPNCGETIYESDVFCPNCGVDLREYIETDEYGYSAQPQKSGKKFPIVPVVAGAVLAVLLFLGLMFFLGRKDGAQMSSEDQAASKTEQEVDEKKDSSDEDEIDTDVEDDDADADDDKADLIDDDGDEIQSDSAAGAGGTTPFTITSADASSTLPGDSVTSYYGPNNAIDGNSSTAWNEGSSGNGTGEWIRVSSSSTGTVSSIEILAGYPKGTDLYERNCRPKDITISFDSGADVTYQLADMKGAYQTITLSEPRQTSSVRITINSVYQGTQYNDCCIAEIIVK